MAKEANPYVRELAEVVVQVKGCPLEERGNFVPREITRVVSESLPQIS
jgi:hypothetical protein